MNIKYELSEEEFKELTSKSEEPSSILRDTNTRLKAKIDSLTLQNTELSKVASNSTKPVDDIPFKSVDGVLHFTDPLDFITLHNYYADLLGKRRPSLKGVDELAHTFIERLCKIFGYENSFEDVSAIKAYRVSLQKKKIIYTNSQHRLAITEKE